MDKVDEKIKITIEEEEPSKSVGESPNVVDRDFQLIIIEGKRASLDTGHINAVLDALILQSNDMVDITISFTEVPGIIVYRNVQFFGNFYLPLRITPISNKAEAFNFGPQKWLLNNSLRVEIQGKQETVVNLTIRTEG